MEESKPLVNTSSYLSGANTAQAQAIYARALARLDSLLGRQDEFVAMQKLLRALLEEQQVEFRRCAVTGNPCGTDTIISGRPCLCKRCVADAALREFADFNQPSITETLAPAPERSEERTRQQHINRLARNA